MCDAGQEETSLTRLSRMRAGEIGLIDPEAHCFFVKRGARTHASAVPQLPPPMMAQRHRWVLLGRANPARIMPPLPS